METRKENVQSMDEIVFESRNKAYGAYQLRQSYNRIVNKSLLIAVGIVVVAALWPLLASYASKTDFKIVNVDGNELTGVLKEETPPPPPPPAPDINMPKMKDMVFSAPLVVDTVTETQAFGMAEDYAPPTGEIIEGEKIEVTQVIEEEIEVFKKPFDIVEEMPEYAGGEAALRADIAKETVYPRVAQDNNIEGRVFVRFVVTSKGTVDQVSVVRKSDQYLDAEAVRVVKLLKKWKPGKQRGEPVNVWYTVPITFQLTKN